MDDITRTQAGDWFARLRAHDCTDAERAAFERWRADPDHARVYASLEDVWRLTADLARKDGAIAAAAREARRAGGRPWYDRHRWPLVAATAAMIVVGIWLQAPFPASVQHYVTAAGEQRTITLDDGSRVVLDTASTLDVRYGRKRSLALRSGQADFTVYKDAARPFLVQAGPAEVTATGTRFQIRLSGEAGAAGGHVTLLEGGATVTGRRAGGGTALAPGQRIAFDTAGNLGEVERLSDGELASAQGWTDGFLVAKDWPLDALVAEANRYGGPVLRLADPRLADLRVSGSFDPHDPDTIALALQSGWPVDVEHRDGDIVLSARQ